ncbi:MAG: hypothetical protein ACK4VI_03695 [Alphaproteobacteria bacterium]
MQTKIIFYSLWALSLALLINGLVMIFYSFPPQRAAAYYQDGLRAQHPAKALADFERAAHLAPYKAEYWQAIAIMRKDALSRAIAAALSDEQAPEPESIADE